MNFRFLMKNRKNFYKLMKCLLNLISLELIQNGLRAYLMGYILKILLIFKMHKKFLMSIIMECRK